MGGTKVGESTRYYARVSGRVQGVGFRYFTRRRAEALGLSGYVRNHPNGDVELEVQGPEDRVQALLDTVRKGPAMGFVSRVFTDVRPVDPSETGFDIRF
jgi:acylphosphatase